MPKFSTGQNQEGLRSAQWIDTSKAFKYHVVRPALGTAEAAEYPHSANDLLWGVLSDEGTQLNYVVVATEGVVKCVNSLEGTINLGDPVILDYSNSGGTTGFVRSAYTSEAIAAMGNTSDVGTTNPTRIPLSNKAVPGSLRWTGTSLFGNLESSGTVVIGVGTRGIPGGRVYYTIDQPILGYARETATTPRQVFKVEIAKQRYIKNNTNN